MAGAWGRALRVVGASAGEDEERLEPGQIANAARVVQERVKIGVEAVREHDQGDERGEPEGQHDRAARATRNEGGLFGLCLGRAFELSHQKCLRAAQGAYRRRPAALTPLRGLGYRIGA